ncbi:MAG: flagellin [Succinivibrio sp.]|nr:flagellin [Succinivibrio sp.]
MALYLHSNISSLHAQYANEIASKKLDQCFERLSSGYKLNSAKDDPAGIQISDKLTTQIDSLDMGNRVAQNGISYAQTAEGALEEITNMLQRIRTLSISASNGIKTENDRLAMQAEVNQLNEEICRIAADTTFGGEYLLDGSASVARFQISPNANSVMKIDLSCGFDTNSLAKLADTILNNEKINVAPDGEDPVYVNCVDIFSYDPAGEPSNGIDVFNRTSAEATLAVVDALINAVDTKRAELGAIQNRLESTINNQSNIKVNASHSRSIIRDTDYAEEASNLTAQNIIQQGSASILTQANTRPQIALQMLAES